MKRRQLLKHMGAAIPAVALPRVARAADAIAQAGQGSIASGPYAGIPYDGVLTRADGNGKWWEGRDPQALYAQNHALSKSDGDGGVQHAQWHRGGGAAIPDKAYCDP